MKLIDISLTLFLLSVVSLGGITLFETAMLGLSLGIERLLTFLLLVLPSGIGAVLAALSLKRRERSAWLGSALLALNALFALFHLMVVLFAG